MLRSLIVPALVLSTSALASPGKKRSVPHLLWFSANPGQGTVDATGNALLLPETDLLMERLTEKEKAKELQARKTEFTLEKADGLPSLAGRKTLTVLTPKGERKVAIKAVEISQGCSYNQLFIRTEEKSEESGGLAVLDGKFPKGTKLLRIDRRPAKETKLGPHLAALFQTATKDLDDNARLQMAKQGIGPEALMAVPGKFAGGATWLVFADFRTSDDSPNGPTTFTYAGLFDAKGALGKTIEPAKVGLGDGIHGWDPVFQVDLDGDGTEELVVRPSYYEGGSVEVYGAGGAETPVKIQENGC